MSKQKKNADASSRVENFSKECYAKSAMCEVPCEAGDDQQAVAEYEGIENRIQKTIIDAAAEIENEIYALQRTINENFNLETMGWEAQMREVSACKALLTEIRDLLASSCDRDVESRKRRSRSTK